MELNSNIARVDSILESVDRLIEYNLDAYCLNENDKKLLGYPQELRYIEYLAHDEKYDVGLFLDIPTESLRGAVSLLIFKRPLKSFPLVNLKPLKRYSLMKSLPFVANKRLIYLLLVSCIPWKKARISGLYSEIAKSVAAKNRIFNRFIRYIHSKIK